MLNSLRCEINNFSIFLLVSELKIKFTFIMHSNTYDNYNRKVQL